MSTKHEVIFADSSNMKQISDTSIDLMITSPPYPMVSMWDSMFIDTNKKINEHMVSGDSSSAFEAMHENLDSVWLETYRVLKEGGIACINIGDATRKIGDDFQLFSTNLLFSYFQLGESQFYHIPHSNSQSYKALKLGVTGISPGDRDSRPTDAADD